MGLRRPIKNFLEKRAIVKKLEETFAKPIYQPQAAKKTLAFPIENIPEVSIIIPFYNNEEYTQQCLLSIHNNLPETSFEIILIDDNSSEKVDLSNVQNVCIIKNKENLGFLKSTNVGINNANGKYIYMLNNDTIVQKGFLDELIDVFKTQTNVGAVGSMLLNRDGSLQEAGSVFLKDCLITQVTNIPRYYPEANYLYEVDYCSGCSLLFQKYNDKGEINLLDDIYSPAYFEETDLCFRLRYQQRKKIFYTPFSKIIHFNGVSYNSQDSEKEKKKEFLFKKNQELFLKRWKKELASIKATTINQRILEFCNNKQIIFLNDKMPQYNKSSGELRLTEIMKAFKNLNYHVTLITTGSVIENGNNAYYQKLGILVLYAHITINEIPKYFKRMQIENPIIWMYGVATFAKYYKVIKKSSKIFSLIFDMVDIHHLRFKRALEFSPLDRNLQKNYKKYLKLEKKACSLADITIPISEEEELYMQQLCPKDKMIVISNIHYPKIDIQNAPSFEDRTDLLFIGSKHTPNIDAVQYLIDEIMPFIWRENPNIKLHIVGNIDQEISPQLKLSDNVIFHGFVHDVTHFFLKQKIMVAPLRYGAGVKGKIGQAFEYFLPIVSTGIGIEGMRLTANENILVAENPQDFANAVLSLYKDKELWTKLQVNSSQSLSPFSREELYKKIKQLEELTGNV